MPQPHRRFARSINRRTFLARSAAALLASRTARTFAILQPARPGFPSGIASGDITPSSGMVWSRTDRPAKLIVEYATTASFRDSRQLAGPDATAATDFTARLDLRDLPPGQRLFYRVRFQDLSDPSLLSEPMTGSFQTPPAEPKDILFAWSGDTCGQGWGINPEFGGMKAYETMRRLKPQFFIHSGDTIYADNPLKPEVRLEGGAVWKNIVTPAKSHVAQTLDDFRGNHAYNLLDENIRRFNAEVPLLVQWDDHEVHNNWFPGQQKGDPLYSEQDSSTLAKRARQAFLEYYPIRLNPQDPGRIYRSYAHGQLLEIFMLDQRSYRAKNGKNREPQLDDASAFLGTTQLEWLKQGLARSTATWKLIAADMPISAIIQDRFGFDGPANGNPQGPSGRELEFASLLSSLKRNNVRNILFITTDVHYATAIEYHPDRAVFKDFSPFWEFISGPIHAGTFGPAVMDKTFGPEVAWHSLPPGTKGNRPPSAGLQFFGAISINGKSRALTVNQYNLAGQMIYEKVLEAAT